MNWLAGGRPIVEPPPSGASTAGLPALGGFARRVLIVIGIGALALFLWRAVDALLLAFAAVLVGVLLRTAAGPVAQVTRLGQRWAVLIAALLLLGALAFAMSLAGAEVRMQVVELTQRLPGAWATLQDRLGGTALERLMQQAGGSAPDVGGILYSVTGVATSLAGALANLVLVVFGGLYLAMDPQTYRNGLLLLAPPAARDSLAATFDGCGVALRRWLLGQLAIMALVGVVTTTGLWLIGLPGYLALGLLAGLAEFVPMVGPIFAAIVALLLALTQGPEVVLWTLLLYLVVQQLESNLLVPLIARHTVALPPALGLFAVIGFGLVFGFLGVLLATPLAVVALVAVKGLWLREALGAETELPGEATEREA